MKDREGIVDAVNAVKALNSVTILWLTRCFNDRNKLHHRVISLSLYAELERLSDKFLEKQKFLLGLCSLHVEEVNQKILVGVVFQSIGDAITRLSEASYPLFASASVSQMNNQLFDRSTFPSIDVYLGGVKQVQDAIINLLDVLRTHYEFSNSRDIDMAVQLREMCRKDATVTFTTEDLEKYVQLANNAEVIVLTHLRDSLEPQAELLSGLMDRAEKMKSIPRL